MKNTRILKILKQIFFSVLASVSVFVVLKILNNLVSHASCSQLHAFDGGSSFVEAFTGFLLMIFIFIIGLITYFIIRMWVTVNPIIYFVFITIIASHDISINIYNNLVTKDVDRVIKTSICNKSSDDGMECEFKKLNIEEYNYIQHNNKWLPIAPSTTQDVTILYYRDDFLGDYNLNIRIKVAQKEKLDSIDFPKWELVEFIDSNLKEYHFNQMQN